MGKLSKKTNYSVSIEPRKPWIYDETNLDEQMKARCEDIVQQIKRHIDDVAWAGVVYETENTCSFCGRVWTEGGDKFNGGCCDEDMKNCPYEIDGAQEG
jgi:hypothetical protein